MSGEERGKDALEQLLDGAALRVREGTYPNDFSSGDAKAAAGHTVLIGQTIGGKTAFLLAMMEKLKTNSAQPPTAVADIENPPEIIDHRYRPEPRNRHERREQNRMHRRR